MAMKKNNLTDNKKQTMACTGCGRHRKFVGSDVIAYFCNHCVMQTGNYTRYLKGLPYIKPLEGIKVNDILLGANGKHYKVIGKGTAFGEDKIYPTVEVLDTGKKSKDVVFLGDYFFIKVI